MTEIARISPHRLRHTKTVRVLLDYLGIKYHKVKGKGFWEANLPVLHELWLEVQYRAKERLIEIHPDRAGGDEEAAKRLTEALNRTREAFRWRLQSQRQVDTSAVVVIPRRGFRNHQTVTAVIASLRNGAGVRTTAKRLGVSQPLVSRIRKLVNLPPCQCGRKACHRGPCMFTFNHAAYKDTYANKDRRTEIGRAGLQAANKSRQQKRQKGESVYRKKHPRWFATDGCKLSIGAKIKIGEANSGPKALAATIPALSQYETTC